MIGTLNISKDHLQTPYNYRVTGRTRGFNSRGCRYDSENEMSKVCYGVELCIETLFVAGMRNMYHVQKANLSGFESEL